VVLNALHVCSLPLFVSLCFSSLKLWKSYSLAEETAIPKSIHLAIHDLFLDLERKFGALLVAHAIGYDSAYCALQ
jgi:hypothetical protein